MTRRAGGIDMRDMVIAAMAVVALIQPAYATHSDSYGRFEGDVVAKWLADGRNMELMQPFAYVAPIGRRWDAPAGSRVDGASIPRFAWTFIGGPFEGKYRNASVIHDVACQKKNRPWQEVHEAFYTAMLASDVGERLAALMFAAVYHFGPRWEYQYAERDVTVTQVEHRVNAIESRIGDNSRVTIQTMPSAVSSPYKVARNNLQVHVVPEPISMTDEQFSLLREEIETNNLSIDAIREYGVTRWAR
jgi:Protein of unknown function (DUF1353)